MTYQRQFLLSWIPILGIRFFNKQQEQFKRAADNTFYAYALVFFHQITFGLGLTYGFVYLLAAIRHFL